MCCDGAGLLRGAFEQCASDGGAASQAPSALAALLAELWFDAGPALKLSAAGRGLKPDAVTGLQRLADDVDARCGCTDLSQC